MEQSHARSDANPPGRPRDPAKGDSILSAAIEILAEVGYASLSIEAVAQRAGVSRPTIYRRYQHKAALAIDVVAVFAAEDRSRFDGILPRPPDRGTLQADLEELLLTLASSFDALSQRGLLPGFLADLISHPDLAKQFFLDYLDIAQQNVRAVFHAAADRGEIAAEPLPEVVLSTLIGAYVYHRFVIAHDFGEEERRTVAAIIAGGLRSQSPRAR